MKKGKKQLWKSNSALTLKFPNWIWDIFENIWISWINFLKETDKINRSLDLLCLDIFPLMYLPPSQISQTHKMRCWFINIENRRKINGVKKLPISHWQAISTTSLSILCRLYSIFVVSAIFYQHHLYRTPGCGNLATWQVVWLIF